jgi:hypothetical protein
MTPPGSSRSAVPSGMTWGLVPGAYVAMSRWISPCWPVTLPWAAPDQTAVAAGGSAPVSTQDAWQPRAIGNRAIEHEHMVAPRARTPGRTSIDLIHFASVKLVGR